MKNILIIRIYIIFIDTNGSSQRKEVCNINNSFNKEMYIYVMFKKYEKIC